MSASKCLSCGASATIICSCCGNAHYCSNDHQIADWSKHQNNCQYYKAASTEQLGQHLVASRNISAGTVILVDRPIVIGPSSWARLVCIGCHDSIEESTAHFCSKCLWPLCSEKCENSEIHMPDCEILSKDSTEGKQGHPQNLHGLSPLYDLIIVIRCLLLRSQNPQNWKLLLSMISHSEKREEDGNDHHHKAIVAFMKRYLVNEEFESEEISHARGVIYSNAMGFTNENGIRLRALYPTHRLLNHSCLPNLHLIVNSDGTMQVRAAVDIKENEILTDSYTGTVEPYWERHKIVNEMFHFSCDCRLCRDPTELGTYFSSPRCFECPENYMCPEVCDGELIFVCSNCNTKKSVTDIKNDMYEWEARLGMVDMFGQASPRKVEVELSRCEREFHPTHYIWYKVASAAVKSLKENDSIHSVDLRYKLWKKEIECLNILDQGLTRRRGATLLELGHVELLCVKNCMLDENTFPPFLIHKLQDAVVHLQECIKCLKLEPVGSNMAKIQIRANGELTEALKLLSNFSSQEKDLQLPIDENNCKDMPNFPQYFTSLIEQL
ncbi:unnamed protein product [Meganyctiphanes norvegica]|uniref:Uncharacterized protein n=1 Tax=Meganyctiphanes norvegica TaxID=48144 RepID=A0AAV2PKY7_MEGNR